MTISIVKWTRNIDCTVGGTRSKKDIITGMLLSCRATLVTIFTKSPLSLDPYSLRHWQVSPNFPQFFFLTYLFSLHIYVVLYFPLPNTRTQKTMEINFSNWVYRLSTPNTWRKKSGSEGIGRGWSSKWKILLDYHRPDIRRCYGPEYLLELVMYFNLFSIHKPKLIYSYNINIYVYRWVHPSILLFSVC